MTIQAFNDDRNGRFDISQDDGRAPDNAGKRGYNGQ